MQQFPGKSDSEGDGNGMDKPERLAAMTVNKLGADSIHQYVYIYIYIYIYIHIHTHTHTHMTLSFSLVCLAVKETVKYAWALNVPGKISETVLAEPQKLEM